MVKLLSLDDLTDNNLIAGTELENSLNVFW